MRYEANSSTLGWSLQTHKPAIIVRLHCVQQRACMKYFLGMPVGFLLVFSSMANASMNQFKMASDDGAYSWQPTALLRGGFESVNANNRSGFRINSARLGSKGTFYSKNLKYKFEIEFPTVSDSTPSTASSFNIRTLDAYANYKFADVFTAGFGFYAKTPFSVQAYTGSSKQQFVDRSRAAKTFRNSKDLGLMFSGEMDRFYYVAGMFNGNGGEEIKTKTKYLYTAILGYTLMGIYKVWDEVEFSASDEPALSIAVQALNNHSSASSASFNRFGGFLGFRMSGFSLRTEYYKQSGNVTKEHGLYAQAGYLFGRFEPAVRYSLVNPVGSGNNSNDIDVSFNFYFMKHGLKTLLGYTRSNFQSTSKANQDKVTLRLQLAI